MLYQDYHTNLIGSEVQHGRRNSMKEKLAAEKRKANEIAKKIAQDTEKTQQEENTDEITASKVPSNNRHQNPTNTRRLMDKGNTTPTKTNKDHTKYTDPNNKFSMLQSGNNTTKPRLTYLVQMK